MTPCNWPGEGQKPGVLFQTEKQAYDMLKILIAVDGSEHADRAIEAVGKMSRSSLELEATLLCVSPEPIFYGGYTAATIAQIEEDQKKQQTAVLAKASVH